MRDKQVHRSFAIVMVVILTRQKRGDDLIVIPVCNEYVPAHVKATPPVRLLVISLARRDACAVWLALFSEIS